MNDEKILVEVTRARVPLKKFIHGHEIRDVMAHFEEFRQRYNEQEFFYGAKVYLTYDKNGCWASIKRPETDKEFAARKDAERQALAAFAERKRLRELAVHTRELKQQAREAELERQRQLEEVNALRDLAAKHGLKLVKEE